MADHVGGLRKDAAQNKIKKKIKVLERYAANPKSVKEDTYVPKDLTSFREWEDGDLGLERIGSPNTLDRPYNIGLKKQALGLIERLSMKKDRKERRTEIIDTLRAQKRKADRLIRGLTGELHSTRHELDQAQQSERRWEARAEERAKEIAELSRKLNSITGLRSVNSTSGGKQ